LSAMGIAPPRPLLATFKLVTLIEAAVAGVELSACAAAAVG